MFSRAESRRMRQLFWTSFGKSFPRKWLLYNTGTKGLYLKFHFDRKSALVALDIECDSERRAQLWARLVKLETILKSDYLPQAAYIENHQLENGKLISRICVTCDKKVSIHDQSTWREVMVFFNNTMDMMEAFYLDYREIIGDQ